MNSCSNYLEDKFNEFFLYLDGKFNKYLRKNTLHSRIVFNFSMKYILLIIKDDLLKIYKGLYQFKMPSKELS